MIAQRLEPLIAFANQVVWEAPQTVTQRRVRAGLTFLLFLLGIVFWLLFFHLGRIHLNAFDWVKEDIYLDLIRQGFSTGAIPWQFSQRLIQGTNRLMAIPELVLTPDLLLLPWLSNVQFILLHVLLMYTLGFWGSLLLAHKLKASFVAFLFFWLVFNFNGYLTGHLGIGHFQWSGYFLLPFFFYLLFQQLDHGGKKTARDLSAALGMGLVLGGLFVNGSFHIAIWSCMFLAVLIVFHWRLFQPAAVSILTGALLGLGRLLPAVLWLPENEAPSRGYPTLGDFFNALTTFRLFNDVTYDKVGIWEYNFFIGFVALTILIASAMFALLRGPGAYRQLLLPAAFFALLSFGDVYSLVTQLPLPLATVERVPSRFIILPFLVVLLSALPGLDALTRAYPRPAKTFFILALPFCLGELVFHALRWRINYIEQMVDDIVNPGLMLVEQSNRAYMASVSLSWLAALITFGAVIFLLIRARRRGRA